jgi:hypothetical protein
MMTLTVMEQIMRTMIAQQNHDLHQMADVQTDEMVVEIMGMETLILHVDDQMADAQVDICVLSQHHEWGNDFVF